MLPEHSAFEQPWPLSELLLAYLNFADDYYRDRSVPPGPDGRHPSTGELENMKHAIRRLMPYGKQPVTKFDAPALEGIQAAMVGEGLSRNYINSTLNRIRRIFRWGVRKKFVKAEQLIELQSVDALKKGRSDAREPAPRESVADEWIEAILPFLSRQVAAMVQLQRLTGMRSDEVCRMRACDIDRSGDIWLYEPDRHKTSYRGKPRSIPLGPQAQEILLPFLTSLGERFLFSPQEAQAERAALLRAARKTKVQPSQQCRRKPSPRRSPGHRYNSGTYRTAVQRAITQANRWREQQNQEQGLDLPPVPMWHPYQLRHTLSTVVRKAFGEEAAQVSLGHSKMDTTALYGERNLKLAMEVARKLG